MDTMNRNSEVLNSTNDLRVPMSWDVDSSTRSSSPGGLKERLNSFKSTCMSTVDSTKRGISGKINDLKPVVTQRVDSLRSDVSRRVSTMREGVRTKAMTMQHEMSSNPAKWAGIATGVGMGVGMLGRYMRHRAHRPQPQFIIIERCA